MFEDGPLINAEHAPDPAELFCCETSLNLSCIMNGERFKSTIVEQKHARKYLCANQMSARTELLEISHSQALFPSPSLRSQTFCEQTGPR